MATNKAMSELIAMALACDLTRVFSVMFTGRSEAPCSATSAITTGHHDLTHNEAGDQPRVQTTRSTR